jgi:structural maintenance of chromosome 4
MTNEEPMDDEETGEYEFDEGGDRVCDDIYIPPPPKPTGIEDGRRLVITRMELHNFKSYGRTQILGPFHKCFTSIVGPNGSGKSNVIDALLFVFGHRAQKLRLKKVSLLIHNSDTYPDCTSCTVKIHFALIHDKLEDQMDIIEGSEFSISRTAFKDDKNHYCIDDKKVKVSEVKARLMAHGIDLTYNRFLILQGEVEQISLMKPKAEDDGENGMLEFLEDIIGTTRLKAPLEQINRRITELNELRAEKMNRCRIVQKEKDALESVKNEAITYLKLENKLIKKQSLLYGKQKEKSMAVLEDVKKEHSEAVNILNDAMKGLDEIKEKQKQKQQDCDEINATYEASSKQLEALNEKYKALEKEGEQNRIKNTNTFEKGKKILADKTGVEEMLKEAVAELPKLEEQIETNQKKSADMQAELTEAEEELSRQRGTLEADLKPLRETREKYEADLMAMQKEINGAKAALELKRSDLDQYLLAERQEKSKLMSLESDLKSNMQKLEEKKKLVENCASDLPESERRIEANLKKAKELEEKRRAIETKLNQENQVLMDAKGLVRDRESRNRVLTKIMEQKRSGAIPGIYGRLGDLATIDKKYDVAISTICGGQLDKILTDCPKTSSQCIDYLKKNNIGTATFSALDQKQKYRHADFDFNYKAERLIDLIEVQDEKFVPAFSDIIRDTLVVETSDLANKIAFSGRGWTVVTLNGHIYRSSGVMTGGGRPTQGKMRLTSSDKRASLAAGLSEDEIQKLEREVMRLRQELIDTTAEAERLQQDAAQARKDNDFIKYQLPTFQMEIEEMGKMVESLKKEIEEARIRVEKVKPDPEKVNEFEDQIRDLVDNFDGIKEKARIHEDQIADVDKQIKSLISEKVGPAERRVNKLKKELEEISFAMSKAEAGKKSVARTIEKCQEKIAQYKKEVHESNELLAQLKARRHEIREELDSIDKEREQTKSQRDELADKVKAELAELNKLKQEEGKFQASNLDIKHKVDLLSKQVEEKESAVAKWAQMINDLKPNDLNGLDLVDEEKNDDDDDDKADEDLDIKELQKSIENLDKEVKKIKPNISAIEEYRQKHALYIERSKELDEVTRRRDNHRDAYENVKNMRMNEFKQGFMIINRKLKEMYRMITLGGDAELEYCDSLDPFLEGIAFSVRPNKKTWKRISNLSGGEKTLSSLSLIFALHHYKPSPLYVMDEIDAALDFKNVSIVGNYIKERTKNTQFLIISLRNNMYELSDRLIGIYKTYNSTKSLAYSLVS